MSNLNQILEEAKEAAPTSAELAKIQAEAEDARIVYEDKMEALKQAAVDRARIFGWVRVGQETGLTPKQLHAWAKHIPGTDLSKIAKLEDEANG